MTDMAKEVVINGKSITVRNIHDRKGDSGLACPPEEARTKQSHKSECDVNTIMKRYEKTGLPEAVARGVYGDFSEVGDYLESLQIIAKANEQFAALPAKIRNQFDNDPGHFLDFANRPENWEALAEMGLVESKKVPGPRPGALEASGADAVPITARTAPSASQGQGGGVSSPASA